TDDQIKSAVEQAESADKVIVTTYTANTNDAQQELVHELEKTDAAVIVATLGNPYDLQAFPDVDAYINTYSYLDVSIPALATVISGDTNPFGVLPVTIPDNYELGHSLDYIDTELSAEGMTALVDNLEEACELDEATSHDLQLHLTAVSHYEKNEAKEKVIKHMENFKTMTNVLRDDDTLSHKAHSYLETEAENLIREWRSR